MVRQNFLHGFSILFISLWLCFIPASAVADEPIYIEADQMSSTQEKNTVLFTGNVDATQGDLTIRSDKMTVYYSDLDEKAAKKVKTTQRIEKLICLGNVEITQKDWLGTSEKMVYLSDKRQVVLTGNAKAWQDQNMVSGDKIIYYMDDGRSEVIGSSVALPSEKKSEEKKSRVKMTILQK